MNAYSILLFVVWFLTAKAIVSTVGKLTLHNLAWLLYVKAAKGPHFALHDKKQELASVNKEKKAISAQDEYAKWTKLNRKADKLSTEITQLQLEVTAERAKVNKLIDWIFTLLITIPIWYFRLFYRKSLLFYLPAGVLPYPLEWALALPFGVTGAVGMSVWMFAVNQVASSVIFLVSFTLKPLVPLPQRKVQEVEKVEKIEEVTGI